MEPLNVTFTYDFPSIENYKVVCDQSNNTPEDVEQNKLNVTVEFIEQPRPQMTVLEHLKMWLKAINEVRDRPLVDSSLTQLRYKDHE